MSSCPTPIDGSFTIDFSTVSILLQDWTETVSKHEKAELAITVDCSGCSSGHRNQAKSENIKEQKRYSRKVYLFSQYPISSGASIQLRILALNQWQWYLTRVGQQSKMIMEASFKSWKEPGIQLSKKMDKRRHSKPAKNTMRYQQIGCSSI